MIPFTTRMSVRLVIAIALALGGEVATGAHPPPRVPIIYSSDLYHPPQDPDDTYDLATLFALGEFDIRAIVLD
jgi:hypothetical protein